MARPRKRFWSHPSFVDLRGTRKDLPPTPTLAIVRSLYEGARGKIRTGEGLSKTILMGADVRQGCLLSSILFNLTIEHVIRVVDNSPLHGVTHDGRHIKLLDYADDLLLVSSNPDSLQAMLHLLESAATKATLRFNPNKCASLSISARPRGQSILPQRCSHPSLNRW